LAARAQAGDLASGKGAAAVGALAAKMMSGASGARIGMIETDGWDTHSGQKARLATQLGGLDALLAAYRDGLGAEWRDTLVLVATEFGRTAAENGTGGTDHGTGSVVWLLGGGLRGGRVLADWPGLAVGSLYEGRDLKPTRSLDAVISTALAQHFGQDPTRLATTLFPETGARALAEQFV
jgi:uncharacterized protein (DUF1501 family)